MSYVDKFAGLLVGLIPTDWRVNSADVAVILWILIWAFCMCAPLLLLFKLWWGKREKIPEANYRSTLR